MGWSVSMITIARASGSPAATARPQNPDEHCLPAALEADVRDPARERGELLLDHALSI